MKIPYTLSLILLTTAVTTTLAQGPQDASAQCGEQMKQLSYLVGKWQGTASYRSGPGPSQQVNQEETIETQLEGTLLTIEGVGTHERGIVFHAYGVINFDPSANEFRFKSYLKEGQSTDAYFKVLKENNFEWGFEIPGGKIRYTITLDPNTRSWYEKGEYSQDGTQWYPTTELKLTKVE
jgi:hypothetical protein